MRTDHQPRRHGNPRAVASLLAMTLAAPVAAQNLADFDRDGFDDLAIGVVESDAGGTVQVLYGDRRRLRTKGNQLWSQNNAGIAGGREGGDQFGSALAIGDFNGDRRADLAAGVPGEAIGDIARAGAVNIIYGSRSGLSAAGDQFWHQNTAGIAGGSEREDRFGSVLAVGDFDGDGFDDLAIGVPDEAIGDVSRAGAVNVLYGTANGLTAAGNQFWHQGTAGIEGAVEAVDRFATALAGGDFNRDGYVDLAVGVGREDIGDVQGAGAVNVIYGSATGLTATGDQIWHQDTSGILGVAERLDGFGEALTAGDFDRDGYVDLAIGAPGEAIGDKGSAGAVNVIFGSAAGLTAAGNQIWHQDVKKVKDRAERGDGFGSALAAADFDDDGYADLAVGVSNEEVRGEANAGAVAVLYGSNEGLATGGNQIWNESKRKIGDSPGTLEWFGNHLSVGDYNNDGFADLTISIQNEVLNGKIRAGGVVTLYGTAKGLTKKKAQFWNRSVEGIAGEPGQEDLFGFALP